MSWSNLVFLIGGILIGYGIWFLKDWLEWRNAATIEGEFDPPIVIPPGESVTLGIGIEVHEEQEQTETPEPT